MAAQSSTTSCTDSAGTATMATSTSPGMSPTDFHAGIPDTESALGLTTWIRPVKLPSTRWRTSARPMVSCRRLAPMIATDFGEKKRSIEAYSARCSRCSITPSAVSVGSIRNTSSITPSSNVLFTW